MLGRRIRDDGKKKKTPGISNNRVVDLLGSSEKRSL